MYRVKVSGVLNLRMLIHCNCCKKKKNLLGIKSNFAWKIIVKIKAKITIFIK